MTRILIADDHTLFREGIRTFLRQYPECSAIETAVDGEDALNRLQQQPWDVLLLDVSMPGPDTLDLLRRIRTARLAVRVIILTMHKDTAMALRYLKAGAHGFLNKDSDPELLLEAIRRVAGGRRFLSQELADRMLDVWDAEPGTHPHATLSDRELTVLCALASGHNLSEIARKMGVSPRTVSTYRSRVLHKMNMTSNAELTRYAIAHGLVV
ncbi:MAG: response regulator transcription factor [Magnetococcales bacterium]|nr:response regulator transcription factor [Magnetococcales bacterium]